MNYAARLFRNARTFLGIFVPSISDRLIEGRKALGLSQQALADHVGISARSQRNYESGQRSPDADYLAALAKLNMDVLYILTGQRSQPASDSAQSHALTDRARLASAIEAVEAGLSETKRRLPSKKKAELVLAAYDLMAQPEQSRDNVIRLVRLAA